ERRRIVGMCTSAVRTTPYHVNVARGRTSRLETSPLSGERTPLPGSRSRMRSLFISEFRPPDVDRAVFGAFQRMRVLLDALSALGPVDLLFLQAPADEGPAASPGKLSAALAERWGVRVSVAMCDDGDDDGDAPGFAVRCLRA